jgi:hypothetical protein
MSTYIPEFTLGIQSHLDMKPWFCHFTCIYKRIEKVEAHHSPPQGHLALSPLPWDQYVASELISYLFIYRLK